MVFAHRVKTFNDRYPLVGPAMWILCVEYFIVQLIVALDWQWPYSISKNTISDLGNTSCGIYGGRFVCSPLHGLMNASFIALGVFMIIGSLLIRHEFKRDKSSLIGFNFMLFAGIGSALVGIFPENTISALHVIGAFLPFFFGNLGIVILGLTLKLPKTLRAYTLLTGIITLAALVLFITKTYLGLGEGGMERIVAYPQTLWLIAFGLYMSRNHYVKPKKFSRN